MLTFTCPKNGKNDSKMVDFDSKTGRNGVWTLCFGVQTGKKRPRRSGVEAL